MKGRGGASLGRRRCRPLSSALWFRARSRYTPLGRRRWSAHDEHEDTASHVSATWLAPGCRPHRGAAPQLRFVVGRYAAQVRHTRPKPFNETQLSRPNHIYEKNKKFIYENRHCTGASACAPQATRRAAGACVLPLPYSSACRLRPWLRRARGGRRCCRTAPRASSRSAAR